MKLPFEVTWSGGKVGLGQPWIGAVKGVPTSNGGGGGGGEGSGSWARSVYLFFPSSSLYEPEADSEGYVDGTPNTLYISPIQVLRHPRRRRLSRRHPR